MGRTLSSSLLLAVLSLLITAPKAEAELVTFQLDGLISAIGFDNAGLLPGNGVGVGTPLSALLQLNTDAIPLTPTDYISSDQVLGNLSLMTGGLQLVAEGAFGLTLVSKRDNILHLEFEDVMSNFGFFDMISMDLVAAGALPDTPLATVGSTTFIGGGLQAGQFSLPPNAIDVSGTLVSVTKVPEPATVLSLLVGAGALLARRRRLSR